ncbi:RagB/SusD family nutrient uptake outer membrane protein [Pedobacter sp. FW305-3-2-15-E-R2A2]|uniref:RagB/SusD family nutrient uptake outer membrane protein n=1 Tax=Pedobacter sp. FW305-3-2-15-E-R2A2 TaxID=3140251 RepID=UPI003140471D
MKKLILIYSLCFLALGIPVSCKKELNALPTQSKVEGNAIIDQKSAEVALNGVYLRLAEGGDDRGTPSILWSGNHEITPTYLAGYITYPHGGSSLDENNLISATDYSVARLWETYYSLLNAANGVIEQVSKLQDQQFSGSRKLEIIAEARLLRAYGHQGLLRYFAEFHDLNSNYGVLLRKEFVTTNNIAQKRSSVKESYDFILADLDDAIAHGPVSSVNYYTNRWVAKAFKARVLMIRGAAGDYAQAVALTDDIIRNSPYLLETHLQDIFSAKGLESKEVMLGLFPKVNQVSKFDTYFYRNSPGYTATASLKALFATDPRNSWMIGVVGTEPDGILKYKGPKVEFSYALRLTEVYLLQAEGIARSGGDLNAAKGLLKTVLTHAGVSDFSAVDNANTPDALLIQIYNETARNLSFEDGQDWSALLRMPLSFVLTVKPAITDKNHFILPIPKEEFDKNPMIGDQNPGYSKN